MQGKYCSFLCRERRTPCRRKVVMGEGRSDGGVGGSHHLIQSSAPWGSWQEVLKGWRNVPGFTGCILSCSGAWQKGLLALHVSPPATQGADRGCQRCSWQDRPCRPHSLAAGGGGLLAGLSKMACRRIQGSTLSKFRGALQWKDE